MIEIRFIQGNQHLKITQVISIIRDIDGPFISPMVHGDVSPANHDIFAPEKLAVTDKTISPCVFPHPFHTPRPHGRKGMTVSPDAYL